MKKKKKKKGQVFLQPGRPACVAYAIMENGKHNNHGNLIKRPPPPAWRRNIKQHTGIKI